MDHPARNLDDLTRRIRLPAESHQEATLCVNGRTHARRAKWARGPRRCVFRRVENVRSADEREGHPLAPGRRVCGRGGALYGDLRHLVPFNKTPFLLLLGWLSLRLRRLGWKDVTSSAGRAGAKTLLV